ncbi:MAG: peptidoglycan-binding protein [Patescibacteria group bacterium]
MNIQKFGANSKKLVVLGMMVLLFAAGVGYAAFIRTSGSTGFSYGYGYGTGNVYGYGYGYLQSEGAALMTYGFAGNDGKATSVSVSTTATTMTVNYSTNYLAKNKIQYGLTTAMSSTSSESAFQTGANSITVTGLTCGVTYYYRVVSTDAGNNIWYSTPTFSITATANCTSSGSVGGGGGGGGVPASTTSPTTSPSTTSGASQALLNQLIATLKSLLLQLQGMGVTLSPEAQAFLDKYTCGIISTINQDLSIGSVNANVKLLQQFLNCYGFSLASSGPGSKGNETTVFGSLTQAALAKFQAANSISPAQGYFGAITRAYLQSIGY